jgi:hypothetical protein
MMPKPAGLATLRERTEANGTADRAVPHIA